MIEQVERKLQANIAFDRGEIAELVDAYHDQQALIEIGKNLIVERDKDTLLRLILTTAQRITGADAGTIMLVEKHAGENCLRFEYAHTSSINTSYEKFLMPLDRSSISGYVALEGCLLNIEDVYELPDDVPYRFKKDFDNKYGYRTKSMLVVPLKNNNQKIIGVIQLINSKEDPAWPDSRESNQVLLKTPEDFMTKVYPFDKRYEPLMEAVANQASIALENARMLEHIRFQFDAFVRASVFAIESRDPSTRGHSERVARMAVALAKGISICADGPYAGMNFSETALRELEYAGLLHDFGKVYIDPNIYLKAKKLYPRDYDFLMLRLQYLKRTIELGYKELSEKSRHAQVLKSEKTILDATVMEAMQLINILNEPTATDLDIDREIERLQKASFPEFITDEHGQLIELLTKKEAECLRIRRGSLTDAERKIIQDHVVYSWEFLTKIPWPEEFISIPDYCRDHHEMLDGSGYPDGKKGDSIPLQARILSVCDIYDALSASDRPYKKALPKELCIKIVQQEADAGKLDAELVRIFMEHEVYLHCYVDQDSNILG
ncbi:MAG: GAF domain-containing protein [Spirochaetes bacterium]|nr:GAF domain-containing protein [Spirochaetota bacterium]MBU0954805.1 GAF domain-containing protein [Spirochaetota bacterium]